MRHGVNRELEGQADEILRRSLVKVTKHSEKADLLTPWKARARRSGEIYVRSGTPDPAVVRGNARRAMNEDTPSLNSREGAWHPSRSRDGLRAFLEYNGVDPDDLGP